FGGPYGDAMHTTAELQLEGAIGTVALGLGGVFQDLGRRGDDGSQVDGQVRSLTLEIEAPAEHEVRISTSDSRLAGDRLSPVDQRHYRVDWSGRTGERSETRVSASYLEESNFDALGPVRPVGLPSATERWDLEGAYTAHLSERSSLQAGLLYRQRSYGDHLDWLAEPDESLGLYTLGESRVQPKVVVEYGLYSSVRDGSISLMPHGGLVVELGGDWKARTSVSRRVERRDRESLPLSPYHTAFFDDLGACRAAGEACYEVTIARGEGDDSFSIGALHREIAETLRLYFDGDFFTRLESVYLVEGDELPELQISLVRRISPKVLAKLESNIASGGGGIFYATDDTPYQNQVRYLVTSLDTRFQKTSTGVFVAFHHLEQAFDPMEENAEAPDPIEMQRLQLMLTQDLSVLADLTSSWAVRLNMELSRGATPYALTAGDELHKRLSGGISVSF
ncbi:MAG: hypothetical protein MI919_38075, partial [Holophagales bacterium]|nr:hypothetical protein [Holophagales bacterium]